MVENFWFEAKNITCIKDGYEVVKELNLKLRYSENVVLLGPNGSGKSSLVNLINRNIYPIAGKDTFLKIFNRELINLWELRKRISTVNSDIKKRIDPNLKVIELIITGLYGKYCVLSKKSNRDIYLAEKLMSEINIKNLSNKKYVNLSDGEKQIALIARALINKPDILILDEPVANLDYKSRFFVIDRIDELSKLDTNILCITHDISIISKIYKRIILLKDRKIIADGNQKEIIKREHINKLFDIDIHLKREKNIWNIIR